MDGASNLSPCSAFRSWATSTLEAPLIPAEAVGNYNIMYLQHYTPTVKSLHDRTPMAMACKLHLLTFLLGLTYIIRRPKFISTWREVSNGRTLKQLIEINRPDVSLPARFEVVITEDSPSFLRAFNHKTTIRQQTYTVSWFSCIYLLV